MDPVALEIAHHRLASVAEEMGVVLGRTALSPNIKDALAAGAIDGVLHYSRRSADAFVALALAALIDIKKLTITHYCVSAQAAAPLRDAGAAAVAAETPDEAALLALIDAG